MITGNHSRPEYYIQYVDGGLSLDYTKLKLSDLSRVVAHLTDTSDPSLPSYSFQHFSFLTNMMTVNSYDLT